MYDNQRLWAMEHCLCDTAHVSPPVLLSLGSELPLVSCPAGMLIGLLQIRQRNCSRNISSFSLCSRSPGSLEGIEALRTQHKPSLPSLPCIYLWFFSFFLFMPKKSCPSIFLLNVKLFKLIWCILSSTDVTLYFKFNWLQFPLYDPALVTTAFE